ncbi:periplasmic binding family protein [Hephaestia caeni]|uniref:Periplasmic binding family protein n=2 Tax=Hephaestia caeni TaxID=645617 RepID=A0A397PGE0_9SPHN|nr:periplasmic binding family protein [Hephaestia caeni]
MKHISAPLLLSALSSVALGSTALAQGAPGPNDGDYALHGAGSTAIQPILDEEGDWIPPPFIAHYMPTGSGLGRQAWRNITNQFLLAGLANPFGTWNTVQYAFSESGTSASELTEYYTNVGPYGLKPIQVPKFVLPVAIAYNPHYATQGGIQYRFQVNPSFPASTTQINGIHVGGMRMPRQVYCRIFNGQITNWNDAALQMANGGMSLGDPVDANWTSVGVPIRLVGRLDRSGTTDIFTRALAAHCTGIPGNHYATNSEALPYDSSGPNFSSVRPDTPYSPASGVVPAGPVNMIGNQYFNTATGTILSVPGGSPSNPAAGANGTGLYLLANGSTAVAAAIAAAPDIGTTRRVNGKVGYIGADFIRNALSGNPTLFAAALNRPSAPTVWHLPSAASASAAFGTVAAPEADVSTGAFANYGTDPRSASRANPLSWVNVLSGLATSTAGYPITGSSQMLLHTCYKANNLPHIRTWLGYNVGTPDDRFTNPTTGLMALSNIGALPSSWQRAVNQTFLTNSTEVSNGQTLGALNLWMAAGGTAGHCFGMSTLPGASQPGM